MYKKIYVILDRKSKAVKIGISDNPSTRIKQLQTGCSNDLDLLGSVVGSYSSEASCHACLAKHSLGGEWFKYSAEVQAFVDSLLEFGVASAVSDQERKNFQEKIDRKEKPVNHMRVEIKSRSDLVSILRSCGLSKKASKRVAAGGYKALVREEYTPSPEMMAQEFIPVLDISSVSLFQYSGGRQ